RKTKTSPVRETGKTKTTHQQRLYKPRGVRSKRQMFTLDWLCGQAAFIYTFNKPAVIVDRIVGALVDTLVPGRGAGESNWFWRNVRSLERESDRLSTELDVRSYLRDWVRRVIEASDPQFISA
ncbi:hypothetical protein THAOC_18602, partial [Thalassiosira oceanica]